MMIADDLLKGAYDTHVHGYPDVSLDVRSRIEDEEIAETIEKSGMKGYVLKSHMWPTVGKIYYLKKKFPNLDIISSITLNLTVGGLSPIAVESAAKQGAKVIFMPTWSAKNDLTNGGFSSFMKTYLSTTKRLDSSDGIEITDKGGQLKSEITEILNLAKEYKMIIATGHVSPKESLLLAKEAQKIGDIPVIFSHPDSKSVGGNLDDMKKMAKEGAFIEICALGLMPAFQRITPQNIKKIVEEIGSESCILSTDFFFDWAPPPAEMLRMTIGTLLMHKLSEMDIKKMICDNPKSVLKK